MDKNDYFHIVQKKEYIFINVQIHVFIISTYIFFHYIQKN